MFPNQKAQTLKFMQAIPKKKKRTQIYLNCKFEFLNQKINTHLAVDWKGFYL